MSLDWSPWFAGFAGLSLTVAAMVVLRPIAYVVDLLDRPGGHKTHHGAVPVVGGLAMLLGVVFGIAIAPPSIGPAQHFLVSATLLVIVGLFDDRFSLSPQMRLVAQFIAVLPMVFGADVYLHDLGNLFGSGTIELSGGHLLATAFVTIAAVNAFNMLDGLDGLAGGIALVALLAAISLGMQAQDSVAIMLAAVLAGAVIGFLIFNVPVRANRRIRCFMGDAGSTLLGFAIAWISLSVSQRPGATVSPLTTVWLVAVPATDLIWTVIRRLARRQSPFRPDSEHLHHTLLAGGLGVRAVFLVMVAAGVLGACIGLGMHHYRVPEWASLLALVGFACALVAICRHPGWLLACIPRTLRRLPQTAHAAAVAEARKDG